MTDEQVMYPAEGTWCWVYVGDTWFPAKYDSSAAGGWTNGDTWEDFCGEVSGWQVIPLPKKPFHGLRIIYHEKMSWICHVVSCHRIHRLQSAAAACQQRELRRHQPHKLEKRQRNVLIYQSHLSGQTLAAIALEYGLTRQRVYQICSNEHRRRLHTGL